jgi:hypothetical protein
VKHTGHHFGVKPERTAAPGAEDQPMVTMYCGHCEDFGGPLRYIAQTGNEPSPSGTDAPAHSGPRDRRFSRSSRRDISIVVVPAHPLAYTQCVVPLHLRLRTRSDGSLPD